MTMAYQPQWQMEGPSSPNKSAEMSEGTPIEFLEGLPSEEQLVLLCLDYLRDLRRSYSVEDLYDAEGLDADYLSLAIYALSRSFARIPLKHKSDANFSTDVAQKLLQEEEEADSADQHYRPDGLVVPPLDEMMKEILYSRNPKEILDENREASKQETHEEEEDVDDGDNDDVNNWYPYDDYHVSNGYRFYALNGLACGPTLGGSLTLGELTAAGLAGLGARSRGEAEEEMTQSPLFDQFLQAVEAKGFFRDLKEEKAQQEQDPNLSEEEKQEIAAQLYHERYTKVVSKFRTKLAATATAQQEEMDDQGAVPLHGILLALNAAERQQARREYRMAQVRNKNGGVESTPPRSNASSPDKQYRNQPAEYPEDGGGVSVVTSLTQKLAPTARPSYHPVDEQEAECLKTQGNAYMQSKDYVKAVDAYTAALALSPAGPNSHVFFSNRAAAHLSQRNIKEAVLDSERSLALKPDYAKAHARLGLSHFLSGDYVQSVESYRISLKYDPTNASSQKYLEKALKRVKADAGNQQDHGDSDAVSVSGSVFTNAVTVAPPERVVDEREAEKFKVKGNSYMASRNYQAALDAYSEAIRLCPDGRHSHVYFSNRAAALCYLERYQDAQEDSLKSLQLNPKYGKAHARLGLSRFFMGDYKGAVEAYSSALEYDPQNAASKSYLAKARDRLRRQELGQEVPPSTRAARNDTRGGVNHNRPRMREEELSGTKKAKPSTRPKTGSQYGGHSNSSSKPLRTSDRFLQNKDNMAMADPSMMEAVMLAQKETS